MSEFGGLGKHENNQHALVVVPPKTDGLWLPMQVAEELKTVTYATDPLLWRNAERKEKKKTWQPEDLFY